MQKDDPPFPSAGGHRSLKHGETDVKPELRRLSCPAVSPRDHRLLGSQVGVHVEDVPSRTQDRQPDQPAAAALIASVAAYEPELVDSVFTNAS